MKPLSAPSDVAQPAAPLRARPAVAVHAVELRDGIAQEVNVHVAEETPIALVYNGHPHAVMLASPADLEDFAVGFTLTEGIVQRRDEILDYFVHEIRDGVELHLEITPERLAAIESRHKSLPGRSGCGLCGTQMLVDAIRNPLPVAQTLQIASTAITHAFSQLNALQPEHQRTGAVHAAAWSTLDGTLVAVREDIGRHNALDKLIGHLLRSDIARDEGFVLLTSRASYELVQKAVSVGIQLLAAVSAPTALAVRIADQSQASLIGFARGSRLTVYAGSQRVRLPS